MKEEDSINDELILINNLQAALTGFKVQVENSQMLKTTVDKAKQALTIATNNLLASDRLLEERIATVKLQRARLQEYYQANGKLPTVLPTKEQEETRLDRAVY